MGKKMSNSAAIFALASVWFGAHVGGGFATGNQTMQYFVRFGRSGIWMPILVMAVVGLTAREIIIMARNHKTYNYRTWALVAYNPFEKVMAVILEASTLLLFLLATSAAIAGSAALISSYGIPYGASVLITGCTLLLLSVFGTNLVAKASSFMTVIMVVSLLVICFTGLHMRSGDLSSALSVASPASSWEIFWSGMKYAGFQAYAAITMIPFAAAMYSEKSVNKAIGLGFLFNAVMTVLTCMLLLAWVSLVRYETLPILTICRSFGNPVYEIIYAVMLIMAFVSTGLGAIFGSVTRFESIMKKPDNITVRRIIIAVTFMGLAMSISMFGLTKIVMVGYGYSGMISIFVIIIPMLTIGHIKNRRFKQTNLESENQEGGKI